MLAQFDGSRQVDCYPMHPAVVHAASLCLQAFAQRDDQSIRMTFKPSFQELVDPRCPRSKRTDGLTEVAREIVIDGIANAHAVKVHENTVVPARFARSIVKRPQHRLRYTFQPGFDFRRCLTVITTRGEVYL